MSQMGCHIQQKEEIKREVFIVEELNQLSDERNNR